MRDLTEAELVEGLQPIRQFVVAQVLFEFLRSGLFGAVKSNPGVNTHDLADRLALSPPRVAAVLRFLANEGYVNLLDSTGVELTAQGAKIEKVAPWYFLLVGGYSKTFAEIGECLKSQARYATRDGACVGIGSCGISQHDALPMTKSLLHKIDGHIRSVVDLGCGDGSYLLDLCLDLPDLRGIGFDPEPASVALARKTAQEKGVSDRVDVQVGTALTMPSLAEAGGPYCFITAFVLQELLEQTGRTSIVEMLRSTFNRHPTSYWIVVEVDDRWKDGSTMSTQLGLAYYNPYYLIHTLTEQRLESLAFWTELFSEAGLAVVAVEHPDPAYDHLKLKTGFLLRLAGQAEGAA